MSIFGNPFDLNGDGKTDFVEEAMMFAMLEEMEQEEESELNDDYDSDDFDSDESDE